MKRRDANDPVRKEAEAFTKARQELFIAWCKSLYVDRFVEWLNKKLTKQSVSESPHEHNETE
jgi:hypothetical protein